MKETRCLNTRVLRKTGKESKTHKHDGMRVGGGKIRTQENESRMCVCFFFLLFRLFLICIETMIKKENLVFERIKGYFIMRIFSIGVFLQK